MKSNNIVLLIFAAAISSCSHSYYFPNSQAVPLFTQKNEVQASIVDHVG